MAAYYVASARPSSQPVWQEIDLSANYMDGGQLSHAASATSAGNTVRGQPPLHAARDSDATSSSPCHAARPWRPLWLAEVVWAVQGSPPVAPSHGQTSPRGHQPMDADNTSHGPRGQHPFAGSRWALGQPGLTASLAS
ncbi:hypothetical protein Dimus_029535 [Dionaea muscipula]